VTFLLTLVIGHKIKYGGGEARMGEWLGKNGIRGKLAQEILKTTTLSHGGNIMILPIAYAEAHHTQIVDGLNKMTLDPTPVEAIQAKPKPTLISLLAARIVAWSVVFISFFGLSKKFEKTLESFELETGKLLCEKLDNPKTQMVETIVDGVKKIAPQESKTFRYGRLAAQDIFATIAAGTLLYFGSHLFARRKYARQDLGPLSDAPHMRSTSFGEVTPASEKDNMKPSTNFSERIRLEKSARVEEAPSRS
jgi:hypothetical protein